MTPERNGWPGVSGSRRSSSAGGSAAAFLLLLALMPGLTVALPTVLRPSSCGFTVAVAAEPETGTAPLLVRFNATVSAGTPSEFDWNFGDGSDWNSSVSGAASPLHRYDNPGSYTATVVVTESACAVDGSSLVVASPGALAVVVAVEPGSGVAPLTVEFSATVSGGSGTYVSALWRFGDGGVGSGIPVAYTYQKAGTFEFAVNVTDSSGHWAVASGTETIRSATTGGSTGLLGLSSTTFELASAVLGIVLVAAAGLLLAGRGPRREDRHRELDPPRTLHAPGAIDGSLGREPEAPIGPSRTGPDRPEMTTEARGVAPPDGRLATESPQENVRAQPRSRVQLTQRVVLHIGGQGRIGPDEIGTFALTQAGMAAALGAGQSTLTNVLRRLVAAGVLTQDVRHVAGQPRRLRVYSFTARGESVYRDLRGHRTGPRSDRPGETRRTEPDASE